MSQAGELGSYPIGANADFEGHLLESIHSNTKSDLDGLALSTEQRPSELRATELAKTANELVAAYEISRKIEHLEQGISLLHDALRLCPPQFSLRSTITSDVAIALKTRFLQFGNTQDLEDSISLHRDALDLRPPAHPDCSMSLNNLADALVTRYKKLGNAGDLEDSIFFHREALGLRSPGHSECSTSLNNLANALYSRFDMLGNAKDLEECILLHRNALALRPPGHLDHTTSLDNLASALNSRYVKFGNVENLEDSITFHREALSLRPPSHPDRSASLNNLANALNLLYKVLGNAEDLEHCIALHRDALKLHPPGHSNRSMSLYNLANALQSRYTTSRSAKDLEDCIIFYGDAVKLCPPGHPHRSMPLCQLGVCLIIRHGQLHEAVDFRQAFILLEQSANDSNSYLQHRLRAAQVWVRLARASQHKSKFLAYGTLIQLVNRCLIFLPSVELQQRFLANANISKSLACDAVSAAIEAGNLELAVEFLEQGRSMLWSRVDAYKYPLHELRQAKGGDDLADRLQTLSSKLERLAFLSSTATLNQDSEGSTKVGILDNQMKEHRILSQEWEDVVEKVREIEGFGSFLRAAPFHTLKSAADEGSVILVNISEYRSDAIILLKDRPPELVNLPDVRVSELLSQKWGCTREIIRTLVYLWDNIVSSIVDRLIKLGVPKNSRIWWCPTGALCALPLHAAGRGKKNLRDIYISSYTSTLTSLIRARSIVLKSPTIPKLLVVGQPSQDLRKVVDEVDIIKNLGPSVDVLFGPEANRETVLESLKEYTWVHFACGSLLGDKEQPFRTSFKLHEEVDRQLHLLDLVQARLPNAELAFLSTCHSAAGGLSTPDESIHLSAALQFCGFKSVVGTLWEMADDDGPTIAEKFYEYMFRNPDKIDFRDSARALNSAIKQMRMSGIPLERLAMFVHIGA